MRKFYEKSILYLWLVVKVYMRGGGIKFIIFVENLILCLYIYVGL